MNTQTHANAVKSPERQKPTRPVDRKPAFKGAGRRIFVEMLVIYLFTTILKLILLNAKNKNRMNTLLRKLMIPNYAEIDQLPKILPRNKLNTDYFPIDEIITLSY